MLNLCHHPCFYGNRLMSEKWSRPIQDRMETCLLPLFRVGPLGKYLHFWARDCILSLRKFSTLHSLGCQLSAEKIILRIKQVKLQVPNFHQEWGNDILNYVFILSIPYVKCAVIRKESVGGKIIHLVISCRLKLLSLLKEQIVTIFHGA